MRVDAPPEEDPTANSGWLVASVDDTDGLPKRFRDALAEAGIDKR